MEKAAAARSSRKAAAGDAAAGRYMPLTGQTMIQSEDVAQSILYVAQAARSCCPTTITIDNETHQVGKMRRMADEFVAKHGPRGLAAEVRAKL
jgi:hypothetical protein